MPHVTGPESSVALILNRAAFYPEFPYAPHVAYPEFGDSLEVGESPNFVFDMLRRLLFKLGLDADRYDTPNWNPFGDLIRPGMKVVIKPNWVREFNAGSSTDVKCMYTQTAVVRAVLDYVFKALDGKGRVIVGDAPVQSCNLTKLLNDSGMYSLVHAYKTRGLHIEIRDFRLTLWQHKENAPGDSAGNTLVDLGSDSLHSSQDFLAHRYRVACYNPAAMRKHHASGKHEYSVCNSALDADVIINLPKLKTHKKAGLTAALKNLIGFVGNKEFLPHYIKGGMRSGGDEYQNDTLFAAIYSDLTDLIFSDLLDRISFIRICADLGVAITRRIMSFSAGNQLFGGSWIGNDTLWRTILDLNHIILYYDFHKKNMATTPRRRILTIVDGIVVGEGDGPLAPRPKFLGVLLAGMDSVAVDAVIARMIGFDENRIPSINKAFALNKWPLTSNITAETIRIKARFDSQDVELAFSKIPIFPLVPAPGWVCITRDKTFFVAEVPSIRVEAEG